MSSSRLSNSDVCFLLLRRCVSCFFSWSSLLRLINANHMLIISRFMCADALWTLAMACNVYLTFFWKYDAEKLRSMEKYYFIFCYGVPFVPAFLFLFITAGRGHMYGNATLWCWIDSEWDIFRIATFYGPVWYGAPKHSLLSTWLRVFMFKQRTNSLQACNLCDFRHLHPRRQGNLQEAPPTSILPKSITARERSGRLPRRRSQQPICVHEDYRSSCHLRICCRF